MTRPVSSRRLPRNVWILGFVSLLMDLSSEIYHALLPAFITLVLGLPATALGAIDGIAEATANFAKLASGRLSDRNRKRKPWVAAGYGLAALSKPLFPLAASAPALMAARFIDRIGKGIRGSPRDAMVADETPAEIRGRAFGLRQSLDTLGALLAPLVAIGLMASSWTDNQLVALFVSLAISVFFFLLDKVLPLLPVGAAGVFEWLSFDFHFGSMTRGVLDLRDIVFFLSITGFSLGLAFRALESRRWR